MPEGRPTPLRVGWKSYAGNWGALNLLHLQIYAGESGLLRQKLSEALGPRKVLRRARLGRRVHREAQLGLLAIVH